MIYLKQSTASQEVLLGPFVDATDGNTAETALTIANTDIKIHKAGATTLANKNSGGGTHISNGNYYAVLDATDTDTLGSGSLTVQVAGALAVRHDFVVLPANIYDSVILGTDLLDVSTTQFNGTAVTASAGRPEVNTTHAAGTAWASGAIVAGALATGAITNAKFAAGAIDAAAIADNAIDLATFAADAKALMGVVAFGTAQSVTGTTIQLAAAEGFANDELIGATVIIRSASTGAGQARVITDYVNATDTATVDAWTTTPTGTITYIVLATPPASTSSPIAANVTQFAGSAITSAAGIPEVKVASLAAGAITATSIAADAITDAKVAADVTIASVTGAVGSVTGAVGSVTGNVGGNVVGSVASVTAGVTLAANSVTAAALAADAVAEIADGVWDEAISGHLGAGSTGNALNAAGSAGDPWSTPIPGAYGAGTAGKIVGDNLNATVSSRLASAGYSAPLDAAGMRTAVGLASANLDTQIATLATAANLGTVAGYLDTEILAIKAKTDNLPAAPAATGDCITAAGVRTALGLASANLDTQLGDIPTATENADALLNRDMSLVSDTNARTPLNAFRFIRNKWSVSGATLTVTKENDSTSAWTASLTQTAGADPVTGADPA